MMREDKIFDVVLEELWEMLGSHISEMRVAPKENPEAVTVIEVSPKGLSLAKALFFYFLGEKPVGYATTGTSIQGPQGEKKVSLWDRVYLFETPDGFLVAVVLQEFPSDKANQIKELLQEIPNIQIPQKLRKSPLFPF